MKSSPMPAPQGASARARLLESRLRRFAPLRQGRVRALALRHPRIADLAASFPALLFALAVPRPGFDPACALARVIDGRSLAEVAAAADVPMWLRKLPPEAFAGPLPRIPDGELFRRQIANHLPRSRKQAAAWLQIVSAVAAMAHEPAALWIAREFVRDCRRVKPAQLRLLSLWAWFSLRPETFAHGLIERRWTPAMHIGPALEAAAEWQATITLHLNLGRAPIADMWLQPGHVAGFDFHPLDSIAALVDEASAMRNCLRTFGHSVAHNRSRFWSVRRNGARVATPAVATHRDDPLLTIVEMKGVGNVDAPRDVWWAARRWLQMHDLPQIETGRRAWGTAPLDRGIWQSLWRPYWLAKRKLPEWLPIAPSRKALQAL